MAVTIGGGTVRQWGKEGVTRIATRGDWRDQKNISIEKEEFYEAQEKDDGGRTGV